MLSLLEQKRMNRMGYRNRRNFSRGRSSRGRQTRMLDRGPREMYKSVCSDCGKECEVPFRPTGERPVYCSECYAKRRPSEGEDGGQRSNFRERGQRSSLVGEDVGFQILSELKRIREVLEKERSE